MKPTTRTQHQNHPELSHGNAPLTPPIYQSVKFTYEKLAKLEELFRGEQPGYFYSRVSNPTVRALEEILAEIQGRDDAICTTSGVAAISHALIALLQSGDHVICFYESYKPTRFLLRQLLARYGVETTIVSVLDHAAIRGAIRPDKTKLMIFESPTNPQLRIADCQFLTGLARDHGFLTILDNTFAGIHNHRDFPIDLYIHSLTKFVGGHGDVMAGAIIGQKDLVHKVRMQAIELGGCLDPHAAFLVARGLKTYFLRYERQCQNALAVAEFLERHPAARNVVYPGLSRHPQHALAAKQMSDFGGIISFDLNAKHNAEETRRTFVDTLKIFRLAASLGSTESLVAVSDMFYTADLTPHERAMAGISTTTIRLSIGIEDVTDLINDLSHALSAAASF